MPYSELVKDFGKVRDLMREFYLYGFKKRSEYTSMSARTYDDERRRLESWLGGCMRFERTPEGKNVFLSVNTRSAKENPLYAAWKARSFTDGDITLHFILFDILPDPGTALTLREIMAAIDLKQADFEEAKSPPCAKSCRSSSGRGSSPPKKRAGSSGTAARTLRGTWTGMR